VSPRLAWTVSTINPNKRWFSLSLLSQCILLEHLACNCVARAILRDAFEFSPHVIVAFFTPSGCFVNGRRERVYAYCALKGKKGGNAPIFDVLDVSVYV
jgi:hypothetical protein